MPCLGMLSQGLPIDRPWVLGSNSIMSILNSSDKTSLFPNVLGRAWRVGLDLLLPRLCLGCSVVVDAGTSAGNGALCGACWAKMSFVSPPYCGRCGYPFELGMDDGDTLGTATLCGVCVRAAPAWGRARSVFRYDDASRPLILGFKHGDKIHGAPAYGAWLARAGGALVDEADLIVPVPLHRNRLFMRRYNQAALLALALGRVANTPVIPDLLRRIRSTPSQGRLNRARRKANVRGAFAINPRFKDVLKGKRVLLVDDVLTTGATAEATTRTLWRAGAAMVDVLTLARVVRES